MAHFLVFTRLLKYLYKYLFKISPESQFCQFEKVEWWFAIYIYQRFFYPNHFVSKTFWVDWVHNNLLCIQTDHFITQKLTFLKKKMTISYKN